MTHRNVKILEDGTRVYADYHRYKPVPPEQRKKGINKPDDPRAIRYHGIWVLPLDLAPDKQRVMPETRPDSEAYDHCFRTLTCRCQVCLRPEAERWRRKWKKENL